MEWVTLFPHRREEGFFIDRSRRVASLRGGAGTFPGVRVAAAPRRKT
jgi:hypothetical protein